ncbi:hypothetical protein F5Y06DRAFT_174226 [Hypoxylon sp. FL0890]|nr:hypothetical protein F5Y06DRAFT_174226 [Hypoxylon sp. FL0890]
MSALKSFPLFFRLPAEIRLMVWEYFALSKAPIIYICRYGPSTYFSPGYQWFGTRTSFESIHFTTVRSLMQVNREARNAILNTMQLCKLPDRSHLEDQVLFVDWEKDTFWFQPMSLPSHPILRETTYKRRIRNIAFDIPSLDEPSRVPHATKVRVHRICQVIGLDFESLCRVQFIISPRDLSHLYRTDHPEGSRPKHIITSKFAFQFIPILSQAVDLLLEDDPNRYSVAGNWRRTFLQDWVDKITKAVSPVISEKCKRTIDVSVAVIVRETMQS